jgi:hypothetical protein
MAIGFSWISLDFLVRIETYQWVIRHKRAKVFHRGSSVAVKVVETEAGGRDHMEAQNCSWAILPRLPIFRNGLSSRHGLLPSKRSVAKGIAIASQDAGEVSSTAHLRRIDGGGLR